MDPYPHLRKVTQSSKEIMENFERSDLQARLGSIPAFSVYNLREKKFSGTGGAQFETGLHYS